MLTFITGLIGGLLYPLFSIIFLVIDLLQGIFYGLAGVGNIQFDGVGIITAPNGGDGGETSTGLIYYLLTSDLAKNLFLSIMLLAVFLIIIFTGMAFIKNAYASKQKNWQEIVGNAFKGLANFIFIPVCCLLGVWLSNILLLAINAATSTGNASSMSRKLFICCAYDANEYRTGGKEANLSQEDAQALQSWAQSYGVDVDVQAGQDGEYYAAIVDRVFAESTIDIHFYVRVEQYYSLFSFNYLVLIVGGVFMLYVLASVAYAMVKRMFILLMLFVISPAICAMYPLDEGSAVGNWKKEFIKYTIAAYGAVAGMNLFFSILPIVENINIISFGGAVTNDIFQLLIMVSGLFVVKEFMGTLSGWIGGDNAMATGESMRKQAKGAVSKYATGTAKVAKGVVGAFHQAKGAAAAGGAKEGFLNFGRSLLGGVEKMAGLGSFGSEMLPSNWKKDMAEKYKSGRKDATERTKLNYELDGQEEFNKRTRKNGAEGEGAILLDTIKQQYHGMSDADITNKDSDAFKELAEFIREYVKKAGDVGISKDDAIMDVSSILHEKGKTGGYGIANEMLREGEKNYKAKEEADATALAFERDKISKPVGDITLGLTTSQIAVDAQNAVMQGLLQSAGAGGVSADVIAAIQQQIASGQFGEVGDNNIQTEKDLDFAEKWQEEVEKMKQANSNYISKLNELQGVAEMLSRKFDGLDQPLNNFKKRTSDAGEEVDELVTALQKVVKEGKPKSQNNSNGKR